MLEALFGTQPDVSRRRRSDSFDETRGSSWGVWGDVGQILNGSSDTPAGEMRAAQASPRTLPSSPNDADVQRAQSPHGSESPVTVLAEDATISPGGSGNWLPFLGTGQASASVAPKPVLPADGPHMEVQRALDQLHAALMAWESTVKSRGGLSSGWRPDRAYRREEQAVEVASAALEDVRAKLAQEGVMRKVLGSQDSQQGAKRGHEVLRALAGHSPWSDKARIQELLRRRADYLLNQTFDPHRSRFPSAKDFLQLVSDRRRWPQAEPLALQWPDVLERTLGRNGAEDWKKRAQSLLMKTRSERQKNLSGPFRRSSSESWQASDFLDLCHTAEGTGVKHEPGDGDISGQFMFTKIRAYNLRSADVLDESDPFVRFELSGLAQAHTSVVWNNETNPEWKDPDTGRWEEVVLNVMQASLDHFPQLQISVWDKDHFTHNDSLGSQTLSLVDLLQKHGGYSSASRALAKPATCSSGTVVLQGPGAGDRGPCIRFDIAWVPGIPGPAGVDSFRDPLALPPEEDEALQLVAEMEMELPIFLKEFGPKSAESLGFFLQPQDCNTDVWKVQPTDKTYSNSEVQRVKDYNELLNKLKNRLQHHHMDFREITNLLQELQEVETRAGSGAGRRIFAFQDEDLPVIGEWSTDRRRQLRNQLFLAKLDAGVVAVEHGWNPYLLPTFEFLAVFFCLLSLLVLALFRDEDGRGWVVILSSLAGFVSVAVALTVSLPKWKPYFDKPRTGANSYQTIASSA